MVAMKSERVWVSIVAVLGTVALLVWGGSIRWSNPDMTEQRLFMTFWREYLAMVAGYIALVALWTWAGHRAEQRARERRAEDRRLLREQRLRDRREPMTTDDVIHRIDKILGQRK
jgi:type II secretory pathway pseudopilin PulG